MYGCIYKRFFNRVFKSHKISEVSSIFFQKFSVFSTMTCHFKGNNEDAIFSSKCCAFFYILPSGFTWGTPRLKSVEHYY